MSWEKVLKNMNWYGKPAQLPEIRIPKINACDCEWCDCMDVDCPDSDCSDDCCDCAGPGCDCYVNP